ncbi:MAG TPA: hypothetical protein VIM79_04410 [Niastella sp.]
MKKIILFGLAVLVAFAVTESCKKKKDGGSGDRCGESEIKVATIPANGTVDPPAPGTTFPLVVNVESMPASGASIAISAKAEGNSTAYYTDTLAVAKASNSFQITNTPAGVTCVVSVTVTSKTCNTNQWKGSYRYSAK